jgi:hypothetical protein
MRKEGTFFKRHWKKLMLGFLGLAAVSLFLVMSESGARFLRASLEATYERTAPENRRELSSADWYLKLAYWEGFICGRQQLAVELYQDFLGILPVTFKPWEKNRGFKQGDFVRGGRKLYRCASGGTSGETAPSWGEADVNDGSVVWTESPTSYVEGDFWQRVSAMNEAQAFHGKFDGRTKTGWGVLHPRAPEAYAEYVELMDSFRSGQAVDIEARRYVELFDKVYKNLTGERTPHRRFFEYWPRVEKMLNVRKFGPPPRLPDEPPEWREAP